MFADNIDNLEDPKHSIVAPIIQDYNATNSGIGNISSDEKKAAKEKSDMAQKVMKIRDKSLISPKSITKNDLEIVQKFIDKYFAGTSVSNFISTNIIDKTSNSNVSIKTNPGDYQAMNLWLPGKVQEKDYWCAPASGYAVLRGRGISVTQSELANKMKTTTNGTLLGNVAPALNQYNGRNGNRFRYVLLMGPGYTAPDWPVKFTNSAISTLLGGYGVIYDVHQIKGSKYHLQGYETMKNNHIYHYVAGEGFNSYDPSKRICYYYDSNNQKHNLGDRHMEVTFYCIAVLCNDRGLIF
ncbi:C39 family peptidase [Thermosyntropha sp.]|uniref:C39 family peptidase n=1 Tax=Thermosyntropha sp. TaxID=2740820 RepID=UPI0025E0FA9B|nr:C39 family peptidase [Thermosyntropha sp.]MBO8158933.1 C39 family peptidase [Thermosyntropha sp.]